MEKVYDNKELCCGCGTCSMVCPQNAISMKQDDVGFIYPFIDQERCIDCGACKRGCAFRKEYRIEKKDEEKLCFAAVNKDREELGLSASGGVFSGIASEFLKNGGVVCGASIEFENGYASVNHIMINSIDELFKLQGSKYVQSNMWECISSIQTELKCGKKVLFSGTPCQVDNIKSLFNCYVGRQLFTVDIICHGVPNQAFFNDYLKEFQHLNKIELKKYDFRNKKLGWGHVGLAVGSDGSEIILTIKESSYYRYFFNGETYRDSCYQCPYTNLDRVGDITIGDYWGIETYDSQLMDYNGGKFSKRDGVSCLIINTEQGKALIENYGSKIYKEPVDVSKVLIKNTQLKEPAKHSDKRDKILTSYAENGYKSVETIFQKQLRREKIKKNIIRLIPKPIRVIVRKYCIMNSQVI